MINTIITHQIIIKEPFDTENDIERSLHVYKSGGLQKNELYKGINDVKEYYKMVKAIKSRRKRDGCGR